eukprot:1040059-Pelagomonas_calceolata.AAC.7
MHNSMQQRRVPQSALVGLTGKTQSKVIEILQTGQLLRSESSRPDMHVQRASSKLVKVYLLLVMPAVWKSDPMNAAMQVFDDVWGVDWEKAPMPKQRETPSSSASSKESKPCRSQTTARAWADAGCRTLDDVKARVQEYKASGELRSNPAKGVT